MDDTKFNISDYDNDDKDKDSKEADDFKFKIEKSKSKVPDEEHTVQEEEEAKKSSKSAEVGTEKQAEVKDEPADSEEAVSSGEKPTKELKDESECADNIFLQSDDKSVPETKKTQTWLESAGEQFFSILRPFIDKPKQHRKEPGLYMQKMPVMLYALLALTALSIILNIYFIYGSSINKHRLKQAAILANKFSIQNEKLANEKEDMKASISELEKNISLEKKVYEQIVNEKEELTKQLKDFKGRYYKETDGSLEKYANDIKAMAQKVLLLNKEYEGDKKAYNSIRTENKNMKDETAKLNKAVEVFEENRLSQAAVFLYNLGVAYSKGGLYDEAISAFNESLLANSRNIDAHYNLALLYETVKRDNSKAIEQYQLYIKEVPDSIERYRIETKIDSLKRAMLNKKKYPVLDFTD